MAYAGALFADACLRGLNGEPGVEEYAYVESNAVEGLSFFSTKVKLGQEGEIFTSCLSQSRLSRSQHRHIPQLPTCLVFGC